MHTPLCIKFELVKCTIRGRLLFTEGLVPKRNEFENHANQL